MNSRLRTALFLVAAAPFAAVLLFALWGLPTFGYYRGSYGAVVLQTVEEVRHAQQAVAAVTFDYRGFDTLGEEFILFAAVAGSVLLLRRQESEREVSPEDVARDQPLVRPSDAVLATGVLMFPFTLLLGIYVVLHGHLTPGGGFQGGAFLASAFYFVYLSGEYADFSTFMKDHLVELSEAGGAAAFALVATIPLLLQEPYMKNILPLGKAGDFLSAGTLPVFNCCVGVEVCAGFLLLVCAFLKQVVVLRGGTRR